MTKRVVLPLSVITLCMATFAGYQWAKASVAQEIYRDRLTSLQADYQQLAQQYNQAVTPRPVTELLIEDGKVCVIVRKGDGELVRVPTPFNAKENQVYVDYIVADSRLLIRRVFEFHKVNAVPPDKVIYVDPDLLEIQWDPEKIPYGKALSSSNMADGRYVISVTGDGSLGLKKVSEDTTITLTSRPKVKEYEPVDERADEAVDRIGVGDVWRHLVD